MKLSLNDARRLVVDILRQARFSQAHTAAVTETILAGERDGCASHGLYRTLGCVSTLKNGKVSPDATPEVREPAPALVSVDARGGFSPLAFDTGLPLLIAKARAHGLAAMAINHCVHFSALWVEIEKLTDAGLVALACNPSHAWVAPEGGGRPLLGTNPLAFGWPRPRQLPFIFDFATSAIARGEIELHRRTGKCIPAGWGVDADGRSCTDPAEVLDNGAMLTFGGHKGSALSIMVELIAGPLIGDFTSQESLAFYAGSKSSPLHGELIIAINPAGFTGASAEKNQDRAETLFAGILSQGARLPSQRRYEARARSMREGVEIPDTLYQELLTLRRS